MAFTYPILFRLHTSSCFYLLLPPVNTLATELLYEQVAKLAIESRNTFDTDANGTFEASREHVLLDVCCGTGTIGLCLAKVIYYRPMQLFQLFHVKD